MLLNRHVVFAKRANAFKAVPATNGAVLEGKPILVKMVPKFAKSKSTCRGFVAGICRKGDACKYVRCLLYCYRPHLHCDGQDTH